MKTLYFITGSQDLYGEETLAQAAKDSKEMAAYLNEQLCGIAGVVFQPVVETAAKRWISAQRHRPTRTAWEL